MDLLNVGCGQRFDPAWINLDLQPVSASVKRWDASQPLPFSDASFDAVYHSHLLEHLPHEKALPFLRECRRVLKRAGVLRIAVPDLEAIARLYLQALEQAWQHDPEAMRQHRWLVLELYDQSSREQTGGAMLRFLDESFAFAWHRLGTDATSIRNHLQQKKEPIRSCWRARLKGWLFGSWRERAIRWLLGKEYALLQLGRFRHSGEVHQWMYDRVSLRELLTQAGLQRFRCVAANESAISNWNDYHLDTTPDGLVCKPDSLFVEADKP